MEEARRFLRYVFPGLLFIIELSVFLILSYPTRFLQAKILSSVSGIGLAFTVLIASGGLGYLFSILHHFFSWHLYAPCLNSLAVDHKTVLEKAEEYGYLRLRSRESIESTIKAGDLSLRGGWQLLAALWNERVKSSRFIEDADPYVRMLADNMHAAGTSFIACIFAILGWLYIVFSVIESNLSLSSLILTSIAIVVSFFSHLFNFRMTVRHVQSVVAITFFNAAKAVAGSSPITAFVGKNELNRPK